MDDEGKVAASARREWDERMERAGLQQSLIELSERVLVGGCFGMFRLPDEVAAVFHREERVDPRNQELRRMPFVRLRR